MELNNREQNCAECEYTRMYDFANRIYYCDHVDRSDDMGKLGVDNLPKTSIEWCPLREKVDSQDYGKTLKLNTAFTETV